MIFTIPKFFILAESGLLRPIQEFLSPSLASPWALLLVGLVLFLIGVALAQIVRVAFKTSPLDDPELAAAISDAFCEAGVAPVKPLVWNTRKRIANVTVIGFVPGNQVLLISDIVLEYFPKDELLAIVRHEIGHVRQYHPLKRLLFAGAPLVVLMIDLFSGIGLHRLLAESPIPLAEFAIVLGYVIYIEWLSVSVFTRMELEADRIAVQDRKGQPMVERINSLRNGLRRFAVICPSELTRKGGPHPSLAERIIQLDGQSAEAPT